MGKIKRTVCACDRCKSFCKAMPGMLAPNDVQRICDASGHSDPEADETFDFVGEHFAASEGALVQGPMGILRIPTIVPQQRDDGSCVFFDRDTEKCTIHEVAPYGCQMADFHMSKEESDRRMLPVLREAACRKDYQALNGILAVGAAVGLFPKSAVAPPLCERRGKSEELLEEIREKEIMQAECN